jgi:hypothetical protein
MFIDHGCVWDREHRGTVGASVGDEQRIGEGKGEGEGECEGEGICVCKSNARSSRI